MTEKCKCGGDYSYSREELRPSGHKQFTRTVNVEYFSGLYLRCDKCGLQPEGKVFKNIKIEDEDKVFTKSDFAKKIGAKPQSVDSMVNNGRVKVVKFAGKEFIYYDENYS